MVIIKFSAHFGPFINNPSWIWEKHERIECEVRGIQG